MMVTFIWPLSCPPNLTRLFDGADSLPPQRAHHGEPTKDLWDPVLHWSPGSDGGDLKMRKDGDVWRYWDPVSGIPWNYRIDINLEHSWTICRGSSTGICDWSQHRSRNPLSFHGDPGTFAASQRWRQDLSMRRSANAYDPDEILEATVPFVKPPGDSLIKMLVLHFDKFRDSLGSPQKSCWCSRIEGMQSAHADHCELFS